MPYDTSNYWTGQGGAKKKETQQGGDILTGTVGPDTTQGAGGNGTVLNGSTVAPPAFTAGQGGDAGRSGGRFVNFGTWFDLNKDAATRQANQLGDVAEAAGNKSASALKSTQDKFGAGLQGGQTYGGETINNTGFTTGPNGWGVATGSRGGIGMAGGTPSAPGGQLVSTPGEMTRDQAAAKAATPYGGKMSLEDQAGPTSWADMLSGARSAAQGAKQLGTDTGRQAAIDKYYANTGSFTGSGGGTSGNSRLDAALTGVAGQDRFNSLGQKFGGLENSFTAANDASKPLGQAAKDSSDFAQQQYQGAVDAYDKSQGGANDPSVQAAKNKPQPGQASPQVGVDNMGLKTIDTQAPWESIGVSKDDYNKFIAAGGVPGQNRDIGTNPEQWAKDTTAAYNAWLAKQPGAQTSGGLTSTSTRNP